MHIANNFDVHQSACLFEVRSNPKCFLLTGRPTCDTTQERVWSDFLERYSDNQLQACTVEQVPGVFNYFAVCSSPICIPVDFCENAAWYRTKKLEFWVKILVFSFLNWHNVNTARSFKQLRNCFQLQELWRRMFCLWVLLARNGTRYVCGQHYIQKRSLSDLRLFFPCGNSFLESLSEFCFKKVENQILWNNWWLILWKDTAAMNSRCAQLIRFPGPSITSLCAQWQSAFLWISAWVLHGETLFYRKTCGAIWWGRCVKGF